MQEIKMKYNANTRVLTKKIENIILTMMDNEGRFWVEDTARAIVNYLKKGRKSLK